MDGGVGHGVGTGVAVPTGWQAVMEIRSAKTKVKFGSVSRFMVGRNSKRKVVNADYRC